MIRVDLVTNEEDGYTSLFFTPREDSEKNRDDLDFIIKAILGSNSKRGGWVPGNQVKIDVKHDENEESSQN